jgi:hypothetical protein
MPGNPITEGLHVEEGTDEQQLRKLLKELIDSVNKSTDQQKKFFKTQQTINDLLLKDAKKGRSKSKTEDEAFKHLTDAQKQTVSKENEQIDILKAMLNINVKLTRTIEKDYQGYRKFIKEFAGAKDYSKAQRDLSREHGRENTRIENRYVLKSFRDQLIKDIPLIGLMTGIFPDSPGSDKDQRMRQKEMNTANTETGLSDLYTAQKAESHTRGAGGEHMKNVEEYYKRKEDNYGRVEEFLAENRKKKEQKSSQKRNASGRWMKENPLLLEDMRQTTNAPSEGKESIVTKPGPLDPSKSDVQKLPAAYSTGALYIGGLLEEFLGTKEKKQKEGGGGGLLGGLEAVALLGAILGTAGLGIGLGFGAVKLKEWIQGKQKEKADKEAQDTKELQEMWKDQAFLKSKGVDPSKAMSLPDDQQMRLLQDFQKKKYGDIFKKNEESGGWWKEDQKKPGAKDDGGTLPGTRGAQTVFRGMPGEKVVPERDFTKMVELLAQSVETNKQILEELKKNTEATSGIKLESKKVSPSPNKEFLRTDN